MFPLCTGLLVRFRCGTDDAGHSLRCCGSSSLSSLSPPLSTISVLAGLCLYLGLSHSVWPSVRFLSLCLSLPACPYLSGAVSSGARASWAPDWLTKRTVQKVIVVIADTMTGESVERWGFDIECDKSAPETTFVPTRWRSTWLLHVSTGGGAAWRLRCRRAHVVLAQAPASPLPPQTTAPTPPRAASAFAHPCHVRKTTSSALIHARALSVQRVHQSRKGDQRRNPGDHQADYRQCLVPAYNPEPVHL